MPRPLLLDVDTGVDDAIAIALATRLSAHELVGVSTVAGNVPVEDATRNTLDVLAWLGVDLPVYRGNNLPLSRPLQTAREHHGATGLGSWQIPASGRREQDETAPEAIVRLARQHAGEITFVFTGPLTNLAVALSLEPRLVEWVAKLVIMGGAFYKPGNTTKHAEFNIYADPEAAARVAQSGLPATWVGLDVTHQTLLTRAMWDELSGATASASVLAREVLRRTFEELDRPAFPMHDPLAVAVAEEPTLVGLERGAVRVDVGEPRRGETRVGPAYADDAVSAVANAVDVAAFHAMLRTLLS
jgi:inosine-uridine nucleoside N-ribohydrolase